MSEAVLQTPATSALTLHTPACNSSTHMHGNTEFHDSNISTVFHCSADLYLQEEVAELHSVPTYYL